MNDYQERQEARRQRLLDKAAAAEAESHRRHGLVMDTVRAIPMGQPVLVDHHSERRHRRAIERMDANMGKAVQASEQAQSYRDRAESVGRGGISSDDPEAVDKLQAKLANLEDCQARMVAANKLARKGDRDGLAAMGYDEEGIDNLLKPQYGEKPGYPAWALSNNSAEIRRLKARIVTLNVRQSAATAFEDEQGEGWLLSVEDNRVCIRFHDDTEVISKLKMRGFRWAPSRKAWVRRYSQGAVQAARWIVEAE